MAIKFSLRFAMTLLLLHMIAAMLVYLAAMATEAKMAMLLPVLLSLVYYLARDVFLLLPDSWHEISLGQDGVAVVTRRGSRFLGQVANETTVSPYFVVLCVRLEGHQLPDSRVIFPDALGEGAFREICVRLKFA
jgi:hypothetical protein